MVLSYGEDFLNIFIGDGKPCDAVAAGRRMPEPAPLLEGLQPAGHASSAPEGRPDCT